MACWQHRHNIVVVVTSADPTVWRCRWQREIDFNALNGVNLPLAFTGQGGGGVRQLVCALVASGFTRRLVVRCCSGGWVS